MAYFPDLSQYNYHPFRSQSHPGLRNVGWLDASVSYSTGAVDEEVVKKLLQLCLKPVNRTRGWQRCPYCDEHPAIMVIGGREIALGDAEIRVRGAGDVVYASPTLICHYIAKHHYRPPEEFLEAVARL